MSTLKRLEQLLDSSEPRWGSAAQLIERSQHSAQAFWETLVDEDASEEQGLGRAEVMSWHKLMSDAIELMQSEVPASDQRALELAAMSAPWWVWARCALGQPPKAARSTSRSKSARCSTSMPAWMRSRKSARPTGGRPWAPLRSCRGPRLVSARRAWRRPAPKVPRALPLEL